MDGLALYRLNRIPSKPAVSKRKLSPPTVVTIEEKGTDYYCSRCKTHNRITANSMIQCFTCDYRILEKKRLEKVSIKAV